MIHTKAAGRTRQWKLKPGKLKGALASKGPPFESEALSDCCASDSIHPDHSEYISRLNRAQGQIEGITRMISERRYCVEILVQFRAAMSALRNVEASIFESHLHHCVTSVLRSKDRKQVDQKIRELSELLSRRTVL